jgi:SAM-dependent methyltransferase
LSRPFAFPVKALQICAMITDAEPSALDLVYAAKSPEALADAYSRWAESYDRETLALGYCLPFVVTAWLARFVAPGDGKVLDAGCGTGLSGPLLKALGYGPLWGLDMSPAMLAAANARDCYDRLVEAELGMPLPFSQAYFAAFISGGVFTAGHAPSSSLASAADLPDLGGKEVVVVTENAYPPLQFVDPKTGKQIGWEYDAMNEIAKRLNFKVEYQNTSWDAMIQAVSDGQYNIGMTGITIKDERKAEGRFLRSLHALRTVHAGARR